MDNRRALLDMAVLLFVLLFPSVITWLYFMALGGGARGSSSVQAVYSVGKILQFGLPIVYVWLFQRDAIRWVKPTPAGIYLGLAFGVIVAVAMFALYFGWLKHTGWLDHAAREAHQKLAQFNCSTPLRFVLLGAFYALAHSFMEEYYWRWFAFGGLAKYVPIWLAILIASLAFMAHHVILLWVYFPDHIVTLVIPFSLAIAVGGAVWCCLYQFAGELYGPWLSHLIVDAAIFVVGYDMVAEYLQ